MFLHKRPIHGEIHAITVYKNFTEHEMYEWLIANKYIQEGDEETCQELWKDEEILTEIGKLISNNY